MKGPARKEYDALLQQAADARAAGDDRKALDLLDRANRKKPTPGRPRYSAKAEASWFLSATAGDPVPMTPAQAARMAIVLGPKKKRKPTETDFARLAGKLKPSK